MGGLQDEGQRMPVGVGGTDSRGIREGERDGEAGATKAQRRRPAGLSVLRVELCVIDEAVIATGLHSTPRYCRAKQCIFIGGINNACLIHKYTLARSPVLASSYPMHTMVSYPHGPAHPSYNISILRSRILIRRIFFICCSYYVSTIAEFD